MNDIELTTRVNAAMSRQCRDCGFASPVNVLMEIGVLTRKRYEEWRKGRIPYLEAACTINLKKLSLVMRTMQTYANEHHLKPSLCKYMQDGRVGRSGRRLRFSKYGNEKIEAAYATHYVDSARVAARKAEETAVETTAVAFPLE